MKQLISFGLSVAVLQGIADFVQAGTVVNYTFGGSPLPQVYYLAPKNYNGTFYGPIGGPGKQSLWHIVQWNIPEELPARTRFFSGGWEVKNSYADIILTRNLAGTGPWLEFRQNGKSLACGVENDLFFEANTPEVYPGYPIGILPSSSPDNKPLGDLKSLTLEFNAEELKESVIPKCNLVGKVDYGFAIVGIVLNNNQNHQFLFYQILLRDTRRTLLRNACAPGSVPWWWSGPTNYGYNDSIAAYGAPCIAPGSGPHTYKINILGQLTRHIKEAPAQLKLNKNLSQWNISAVYIGTGLEGETVMDVRFGGISLYGETF